MHTDNHVRCCNRANQVVRAEYGMDSTPTTPGTKEHDMWLDEYDREMRVVTSEIIKGSGP